MGIVLSLVVISLFLIFITIVLLANDAELVGVISGIAAVVFSVTSIVCVLSYVDSCMSKSVYAQEAENQRITLNRMLNENYNPDNLQKALDFNSKQKVIKVENESFWRRYWTSVVYVDTVKIPDERFMPSQKLILNIDSTKTK
jgi:hypothetical protein